ncbi:MAG: glycosyltransferase [Candidatus Rokubacteria bacterium]|nr:glycosyltransferase [Candidatus Rokubacteria bacterium]
MRALHIEIGGTYGGSTRALELYLRSFDLSALDHDVLFYCKTPRAESFAGIARRVVVLYPDRTRVPVGLDSVPRGTLAATAANWLRRTDAWVDLRAGLRIVRGLPTIHRLRNFIVGGAYDVVHVNNTFTYRPESILAASYAGKPVVAHMRNPVRPTPLNRWLGRHLAFLLTENRRFREELPALGIACPVEPWYAGIEVPLPRPEDVARVRAELAGLHPVLIGSAGRLEGQKGYECLVRAARRVVDRHPGVRFVVAGVGPGRPHLEWLVRDLGLEDQVHLLGFRTDIPALVSACDLFVSSALWEGLPLAILEAMALGTPVVATDVGGVREVVRPGETGSLVPAADPVRLADAISELLADPARRRAYAAAGRQLALTYADVRARAAALDTILCQVAGAAPRPARVFAVAPGEPSAKP